MALEWPNWVKPVTSKSYGFGFDGGNMNYASGLGGISRANLKYYQNKVQFSCVFVINNGVEMQGFNDWYFNLSNQGTSKFTMDLDSGNGLESHTCIIVPGSLSVTGDFPWTITCTIEAEQVIAPEFDGVMFDLLQGGYTNIEAVLDRLEIFSNSDVLVINGDSDMTTYGIEVEVEVEVVPDVVWELDGTNSIEFDDYITLGDDFYHEFTGILPTSSFHMLSDSNGSLGRTCISTVSNRIFIMSSVTVLSFTDNEMTSLISGGEVTFKYGRVGGVWFAELDGVPIGTGVTNSTELSVNNFGAQWGGTTSLNAYSGTTKNHTISVDGVDQTLPS